MRSPSLKSVFLPGIALRCCGFTSIGSNSPSKFHTGFQYTPVASMATLVTCHSRSQVTSSRNSPVVVPNRRLCFSLWPSALMLMQATTVAFCTSIPQHCGDTTSMGLSFWCVPSEGA